MSCLWIFVATTANLDEVDARSLDELQLLNTVPQCLRRLVVNRVHLNTDTKALGHLGAHRADNVHHDLDPRRRRAAVRVGPLVGRSRHELRQEVPVCGVDFRAGESCVCGETGSFGEAADHVVDIGRRHLLGRAEHDAAEEACCSAVADRDGYRTRGQRLFENASFACSKVGLSSGVVDLNNGCCAVLTAARSPRFPLLKLLLLVNVFV